jgi:peptidyl-prolyl cis-trans isomerase SurA
VLLRLFIALLITCLSLPAAAAEKRPETRSGARAGIAAVVNDDAITFSDIRNRMHLYMAGMPPNPPPEALKKIEQQTLGRLIDETLQMQEAKRLGIVVEQAQLAAGMAQLAANNKLTVEQFGEKIAASGIKQSTLLAKLRAEIAWGMVVRRKLRPQVNVSETEIDNEMNRLARSKGKPEYQVAEIFLPVTSPETESLTREDAGKILTQLGSGASFPQLAKQFSKAPGAAQGGDLGWVQQGQLDPALDQALSGMEPGQLTQPVKTERGYHILFLRDKREGGSIASAKPPARPAPVKPAVAPAPALVEAAPAVEAEMHLMQIIIPAAPTEAKAEIAAKTNRAASLKAELASCDAMAAKAADYGTSDRSDLGMQKLENLPPDIRTAVAPLADNELSAPVRTQSGIAVYMVCSRTEATPATPAPETAAAPAAEPEKAPEKAAEAAAAPAAAPDDASRNQIASDLGLKRLDQMAERYLKDLRATAYIEKRI